MARKKDLLLVFGTSADPVHQGHVKLVIDAVRALEKREYHVREVLLMPVFRYHNFQDGIKRSLPLTFQNRYDMCAISAEQIACELPHVKVTASRLEEELVGSTNRSNFTAETLSALRQRTDPALDLAFLLGADSFSGEAPRFSRWYRVSEIIESTILVISPRVGINPNQVYLQQLRDRGARIIYLEELLIDGLSSKQVRDSLLSDVSLEQLVAQGVLSAGVAEYIQDHQLIDVWRELDGRAASELVSQQVLSEDTLETRIGKALFQKKLTLAVAESCTGGLIGHRITNVPGSSEYFMGGIISYAYQAKVNLLGVSWDTLKTHGAVSRETVLEMAQGVRKAMNTDLGLSVSCIAGPGGATPQKPVGTSWCGLATSEGDWAWCFHLKGERIQVKEQLAQKALEALQAYLDGNLPSFS